MSLVRVMDNILCPELHISLRPRLLTTLYEKLSQRLEVFCCGNLTWCVSKLTIWCWCSPGYVVRQAMGACALDLAIKDWWTWIQCMWGKRCPLHFAKNKSTRWWYSRCWALRRWLRDTIFVARLSRNHHFLPATRIRHRIIVGHYHLDAVPRCTGVVVNYIFDYASWS